jgi:bacteriocin biosynthesis cyclodehydratase domain-containing protein
VAATVHVTRTRQCTYVGAGAFGRRVIELLADLAGAGGTLGQEEIGAALGTPAGSLVAALWRPDPGVCEQADAAAYRTGRPWLPVVMEYPVIYVGPVIRPPHGPCFSCMRRRRVQHDAHHAATAAVHACYAASQDCGPAGYLPNHARMAAAVAHRMLCQQAVSPPDSRGVASDVVMLGLADGHIMSRPVVRCGDCRRCRGAKWPEPAALPTVGLLAAIGLAGQAR